MVPDLDVFFRAVAVVCLIFIPLGLWKLAEIVIWLCTHVRIGVGQ